MEGESQILSQSIQLFKIIDESRLISLNKDLTCFHLLSFFKIFFAKRLAESLNLEQVWDLETSSEDQYL